MKKKIRGNNINLNTNHEIQIRHGPYYYPSTLIALLNSCGNSVNIYSSCLPNSGIYYMK